MKESSNKKNKIALVCVAKNEDNYIKEWIDYHKKIGFDDIYVYQNDWRCKIDSNLFKIEFDGKGKQIESYNHFLKNHGKNYDWAGFFDVDEFLVLKKHNDVKEFISDYSKYNGVGINWVLFGDNNQKSPEKEFSLLKRFTMRQTKPNLWVKSIIKITKNVSMLVHHPNLPIVNTNGNECFGNYNEELLDDIAQINHYFCKTKEEFLEKCSRGRADSATLKRKINEFSIHNFNEIEDITALNFFY